MTRIIAGQFRGRRLAVPSDGTRPTSDRVREAIFSALGARRDFTDVCGLPEDEFLADAFTTAADAA